METIKPIAQTVRDCLADYFGLNITAANDATNVNELTEDIDSLDLVECFMGLEDALGIAIPDPDAQRLHKGTLAELIAYCEERRAAT